MFRTLNCIRDTNHYIGIRTSFIIVFVKMIDLRIHASAHVDSKMEYNMRSKEKMRGGDALLMRLCIFFLDFVHDVVENC